MVVSRTNVAAASIFTIGMIVLDELGLTTVTVEARKMVIGMQLPFPHSLQEMAEDML